MGPIPELPGIRRSSDLELFHYFSLVLVTKHSPEGSQKVVEIMNIYKKTPTRSSLEIIPAKSTSKV